MTHLIKDTFYKEKLYQLSLTSFSQADSIMAKEKSHIKDMGKQELPPEIVEQALTNLGKTAEGPHYSYLSFVATQRQIYSLQGIEKYQHLQQIDVSRNNILTLKPLGSLKYLISLNASHNKLTKLLDFKTPPLQLMEVDCSYNEITEIQSLNSHRFLKKLNVSNNKISQIQGVYQNKHLHCLQLANNEIVFIENLDHMNLTELDLFGNKIVMLQGLKKLPSLRKLDLSKNQISKLAGIVDLIALRELRLSDNKIKRVKELSYLENLVYLSVLDLCFNPVQNRRYYKLQVILLKNIMLAKVLYKLPGLRALDGVTVIPEEIVKAENLNGMDLEDRKRIFKDILQDEEYIDRRLHRSEEYNQKLIEPETESDNENTDFVDQYDNDGNIVVKVKSPQLDLKSQQSLSEMSQYHTGKSLQERPEGQTAKSIKSQI